MGEGLPKTDRVRTSRAVRSEAVEPQAGRRLISQSRPERHGNKMQRTVVFISSEAAFGRIYETFDVALAPCNMEVS